MLIGFFSRFNGNKRPNHNAALRQHSNLPRTRKRSQHYVASMVYPSATPILVCGVTCGLSKVLPRHHHKRPQSSEKNASSSTTILFREWTPFNFEHGYEKKQKPVRKQLGRSKRPESLSLRNSVTRTEILDRFRQK